MFLFHISGNYSQNMDFYCQTSRFPSACFGISTRSLDSQGWRTVHIVGRFTTCKFIDIKQLELIYPTMKQEFITLSSNNMCDQLFKVCDDCI